MTSWVARPDRDLQDLIPLFMENRRKDLALADTAFAAGDFDHIRRLAHSLKGICRPYGFPELEEMSKRLELAGESESLADIGRILVEMRAYVQTVKIVFEP